MNTLFILGGLGDIGSAIVKKFKDESYQIIAPTSKELDLSNLSSIDSYFKNHKIEADVIINSAGWNNPKPCEELTFDDIQKTILINAVGFFKVIQYFLPYLKNKKEGHILGISSLYGIFAREKRLAYVMSKHALNGMIKNLALELGDFNIKVNVVSPGFVDTIMTRKNNSKEKIDEFEKKIPLNHLADTKDIASAAFFLCSPENQYITGQNLIVDGGYSVGGFQR